MSFDEIIWRKNFASKLTWISAISLFLGGSWAWFIANEGGPEALGELLPALPAGFALPVVVAVHMPGLFTSSLATTLNARSSLRVQEAGADDALDCEL